MNGDVASPGATTTSASAAASALPQVHAPLHTQTAQQQPQQPQHQPPLPQQMQHQQQQMQQQQQQIAPQRAPGTPTPVKALRSSVRTMHADLDALRKQNAALAYQLQVQERKVSVNPFATAVTACVACRVRLGVVVCVAAVNVRPVSMPVFALLLVPHC